MEQNHRIRLDPTTDSAVHVSVDMEQRFDFLEVLSLKVSQKELYGIASSDYGALMGRVSINDGFGVPNAKVSIFVERDANDGDVISALYPFTSVYDIDKDGVRYNLLPRSRENGKDDCYEPVGTFPIKNELLDNEHYIEVFEKYFKYTTTTNRSGDYMILGAPIGNQMVHVDIDLSDIGFFSLKPYDLIAQGMDKNLFASNVKFKKSKNLDQLAHVYGYNKTADIKPFWGQDGQAGITQLNINLPINITPTAIVSFGTFTDAKTFAVSRNCRPRRGQGRNCNLTTGAGTVEIVRRLKGGFNETEYLNLGNSQVDDNGVVAVPVPLNLKRKITDEFGNLLDSVDGRGIPTEADIRMKVSLSEFEDDGKRRTAKYLIPNLYNDFSFGDNVSSEDFYNLKYRTLYTVLNYIPRVQRNKNDANENHTGFKRIEECESNAALPFNRISRNFNPLFSVICLLISIFVLIANIINLLIAAVNTLPIVSIDELTLKCNGDSLTPNEWQGCIITIIAEQLGVIDKKFYNDFIVGSLYFPKFRFKMRFKRRRDALYYKYCAFDCREFVTSDDPNWINKCKDTHIVDDEATNSSPSYFDSENATEVVSPSTDGRGFIYEQDNEFFYAARNDVEANSGHLGLDMDSDGTMGKDKLFWATTFIPMGSVNRCSINSEPYIIDRLVSTSHQEDEVAGFLYDSNDIGDCFLPSGLQEDRIYRICEYGVDIFNDDEDELVGTDYALDSEEIDVRKYLCENFLLYNNVYSHNIVSTTTISDADGNDFDIVEDECQNCTTNKPIKNISPYFHYWGLVKGKTALDKLKADYFGKC